MMPRTLPRAFLLALGALAGRARGAGLSWSDWDRRQVCSPLDYATPADEAELVGAVRRAFDANATLKVVGAGHSFSAIALTDGHMVSLDAMDRVVRVENASGAAARSLVTVQGGMRLRDLNAALEARGLALENLGATCEQSVAGATATGTHGTGRLLGSLSTQIVSLRLVASNGSALTPTSEAPSPPLSCSPP